MKYKNFLFLIIFLCSIIKCSSEESLLLNFPTEILYKILHRLKFEERKNLLQTSHFLHQTMLDFVLYEQNLETKKEKITKKFIDNNKLFLFFLDETLKLYKITKDQKNDKNKTGTLVTYKSQGNKNIYIGRGNSKFFDPLDKTKEIHYLYWINELNDIFEGHLNNKLHHSFILYCIENFPQISTLFIDLVKNKDRKYESKKGFQVKRWNINFSMFTGVKNIIIQAKDNIDTIYFPDGIDTVVVKNPVSKIIFSVPDCAVMKKYGWTGSYYYKMMEFYNHFWINDLSIVVNTGDADEGNNDHWSNVLKKLPLEKLKITFYNKESKMTNLKRLQLNSHYNMHLKKLIVKNCNRPIQLPKSLEELYIINRKEDFQLYNCFNSFDKKQLLQVLAYKGRFVNTEKMGGVRGKHIIIDSYLKKNINIISYNELEKLTIKNSPALKTIFISNNKNLKKENCFCDNPAIKWIFKN